MKLTTSLIICAWLAVAVSGCSGDGEDVGNAAPGSDGGPAAPAVESGGDEVDGNGNPVGAEEEDDAGVAVMIDPGTNQALLSPDMAVVRIIGKPVGSDEEVVVRFQEFGGTVEIDPQTKKVVGGQMTLLPESLWAEPKKHDEVLKSAEGFNWQEHERVEFTANKVEPLVGQDDTVQVTGTVEALGKTAEVSFPLRYTVYRKHFLEGDATFEVAKADFGLPEEMAGFQDPLRVELIIGAAEQKGGDIYSLDRRPDLERKKQDGE